MYIGRKKYILFNLQVYKTVRCPATMELVADHRTCALLTDGQQLKFVNNIRLLKTKNQVSIRDQELQNLCQQQVGVDLRHVNSYNSACEWKHRSLIYCLNLRIREFLACAVPHQTRTAASHGSILARLPNALF